MEDGLPPPPGAPMGGGAVAPAAPPSLTEPTRVRKDFSETWLFLDRIVGANGSVTTTATIPDTITSWVISAFATNSNSGLGVAPTQAKVTVFKPFFVSLNLPYSVTRGEQVALQAVVFNYLEQDASVRVTLSKSSEFFSIVVDSTGAESLISQDMSEDITIKAGESSSVFFPIVPADLGHIDIEVKAQTSVAADALRRQLLVEAEGVPKEYSVPVLIDLTNDQGGNFTQTVDLTLPATTVQGSQLVKVSAVGDLMGPSVAGLDSLLRMPTGCGEQTMIGLAPNVYVTDYLKAVNQLTSDIEAKALGFMESGYQRELTYKHDDGSISAFGKNDDSGSMWLTAFVTRVFHEASPHIFVDENVMKRAINWMVKKQSANGSFPEPGRVIHKDMQGEAGQGMGLTCFVYISLLENQDLYANDDASSPFNVAKAKALSYLETEVANTDDVYVQAMAAYAFTLAGSSQAQVVLDKLEAKAVKDGKLRYWRKAETSKTNTGSWHSPHSTRAVDTEMSAYVLLAYAARSDVVSGTGIMQWLAQQRNPHGGFSSTQDTVVALSAMSEFAKMTKVNDFNLAITAQLDSAPTFTFNVDQTNALLLQTKETKTVPSKVKIDASGRGMALVQTSVFYNVESEVEDVTFELTVTLLEEMLNWLVVETCTRWIGDEESSAMAVQEIGIPSGFSVDPEDISRIKTLKRIETENKKVILYFDQIGRSEVCLTFKAERTALVAKSQPASVRVYDYYEPGNQVTAFYPVSDSQGLHSV